MPWASAAEASAAPGAARALRRRLRGARGAGGRGGEERFWQLLVDGKRLSKPMAVAYGDPKDEITYVNKLMPR